eukprot:TRINITY_DN9750_c0_g1_i1.p1 TRINITY_DN9750_c0_g1~~TRINITY_DN9750_c0_g1_i1.p1  ORF type:complete len:379 (+),score=50.08 TRINITY_DN9750_c0_g1_i1:176-1312(+)
MDHLKCRSEESIMATLFESMQNLTTGIDMLVKNCSSECTYCPVRGTRIRFQLLSSVLLMDFNLVSSSSTYQTAGDTFVTGFNSGMMKANCRTVLLVPNDDGLDGGYFFPLDYTCAECSVLFEYEYLTSDEEIILWIGSIGVYVCVLGCYLILGYICGFARVCIRCNVGPVFVVVAGGSLIVTLFSTFDMALRYDHVSLHYFPPISFVGENWPEHLTFGIGFTVMPLFLSLSMLVYAARSYQQESSARTLIIVHLIIGVLHAPCIIVMGWIPEYVDPLHFIGAIAGFGCLVIYQWMHICVDVKVTKDPSVPRKILWGFYAATALATIILLVGWFTGSMISQWAAVGSLLLHFAPWIYTHSFQVPDSADYKELLNETDLE